MPAIAASSALSHLRILDFTRVRAGPTCIRQFADFGADVIKIESPPGVDPNESMGGPRDGPDMQNLHRNKRAMTLNMKLPGSREVLERLVKTADVVAENYRPDVKFRLGIDYESLAKINPRIILASISGFGQDGPYQGRPGFDQIAQGMSGIMSVTGEPGRGPMRVGAAVADVGAGLFAALGIMTALLERERSGKGQWVQSSLLNAGIALLDFQAARYVMKSEVPGQVGNDHPTSMPTSAYKTKDGYINVAASGDGMWKRICELFGRDELVSDERFKTGELRAKNRAALNALMNEELAKRTSAQWIEALNKIGVPTGPIYKMDEVFADPQVKHLQAAAEATHPRLGKFKILNQAIKLSRTPASLKTATPDVGQHTDEILGEIGYDAAAIKRLRAKGGRLTERLIGRKDGAIGWVVFNNPERRNAVSLDMWEAIPRVLASFTADPEVRTIVLTGAGDKAFVSGADISQFEKTRSSADQVQHYEEVAERANQALKTCDKPMIAMIRGYCLGGGLGIAALCDLRIAADDARFSIPAAKMGLGYRASSMRSLVDLVGKAYALEIMLTARQFNAAEAKDMGLVNRVVPVAELERATREYCDMMAANAPLTMRTAKRVIAEVLKTKYDDAACEAWVQECFASEDYKEGRRAFMEKRKPVFKGR